MAHLRAVSAKHGQLKQVLGHAWRSRRLWGPSFFVRVPGTGARVVGILPLQTALRCKQSREKGMTKEIRRRGVDDLVDAKMFESAMSTAREKLLSIL